MCLGGGSQLERNANIAPSCVRDQNVSAYAGNEAGLTGSGQSRIDLLHMIGRAEEQSPFARCHPVEGVQQARQGD